MRSIGAPISRLLPRRDSKTEALPEGERRHERYRLSLLSRLPLSGELSRKSTPSSFSSSSPLSLAKRRGANATVFCHKNTAKIKTCCMRFSLLGKKKTACLRQTVCPQRRECLKSLPRPTKSHAFKRGILLKIFAAEYCGESRKNAEERAYFIVFSAKRQYIVLLYAAWHNPGNVLQ